jgi:hypothetical protein
VLHAIPHAPPAHCATPFGSVGHTVHEVPHAGTSLSIEHLVPHLWVPVMHWKSHVVPSQVDCVAPVGTGHAAHDVPHAFTSITDGQRPLHACCPVGHPPAQAAPTSMHAPLHSCLLDAQLPPHDVPSQAAIPSAGTSHGVHDAPQVRGSSLATQPPGHMCLPAGQAETTLSALASGPPMVPRSRLLVPMSRGASIDDDHPSDPRWLSARSHPVEHTVKSAPIPTIRFD